MSCNRNHQCCRCCCNCNTSQHQAPEQYERRQRLDRLEREDFERQMSKAISDSGLASHAAGWIS